MSTKPVMDTSGKERRRHRSWPEALKREIVAASFAPGASVSLVARHCGIAAVAADFLLNLIAYNLIRTSRLVAA